MQVTHTKAKGAGQGREVKEFDKSSSSHKRLLFDLGIRSSLSQS
jgi:hypothetical protein